MLVRLRGIFNNDLDQFTIFLLFLIGPLQDSEANRVGSSCGRGLNALSIAQATRIPRESTRRKLRALQQVGVIRLGDDGLWYVTDIFGAEDLKFQLRPLIEAMCRPDFERGCAANCSHPPLAGAWHVRNA